MTKKRELESATSFLMKVEKLMNAKSYGNDLIDLNKQIQKILLKQPNKSMSLKDTTIASAVQVYKVLSTFLNKHDEIIGKVNKQKKAAAFFSKKLGIRRVNIININNLVNNEINIARNRNFSHFIVKEAFIDRRIEHVAQTFLKKCLKPIMKTLGQTGKDIPQKLKTPQKIYIIMLDRYRKIGEMEPDKLKNWQKAFHKEVGKVLESKDPAVKEMKSILGLDRSDREFTYKGPKVQHKG